MANQHLYGHHHQPYSTLYNSTVAATATATATAIDSTTNANTNPNTYSYFPSLSSYSSLYPFYSSLYPSSSVDPHSLSSVDLAVPSRISVVPPPPPTTTATASSLWPSFDLSSTLTKRSSQAPYDHSVMGAQIVGQNEAWLTSDALYKRPRLESASNLPTCPQRPGEKYCTHYMLTRTCKFGDACKFDHPIWVPASGIPDWKEPPSVPLETHPERSGAPDCPYFLKTQKCKFGLNCKFNHPKDKLDTSGKTEALDLPNRPSEPLCSFYMKTGKCKFGASCKFHHPKDAQVPSDGDAGGNGVQTHSVYQLNIRGYQNPVKTLTSTSAPSYNSKGLPIRLGEVDCPFYVKTDSCKYGANCRYNHPDKNVINPAAALVGHSVLPSLANFNVGFVNPAASILQSLQPAMAQTTFKQVPVMYPQRPGTIECDYYMKTGECKYGELCKYHHPIDRSVATRKHALEQNVKLTLAGLPRREGVEHCPFYMKTSACRYGVNCKFDHPPPGEVMASAVNEASTKAEEVSKENGKNASTAEEQSKENGDNV